MASWTMIDASRLVANVAAENAKEQEQGKKKATLSQRQQDAPPPVEANNNVVGEEDAKDASKPKEREKSSGTKPCFKKI